MAVTLPRLIPGPVVYSSRSCLLLSPPQAPCYCSEEQRPLCWPPAAAPSLGLALLLLSALGGSRALRTTPAPPPSIAGPGPQQPLHFCLFAAFALTHGTPTGPQVAPLSCISRCPQTLSSPCTGLLLPALMRLLCTQAAPRPGPAVSLSPPALPKLQPRAWSWLSAVLWDA